MSDIRTRLADALVEEQMRRWGHLVGGQENLHIREKALVIADLLLSLPGIAIVEVPEGMHVSLRYDRDMEIARINTVEAKHE